jgi:hypothetical protein
MGIRWIAKRCSMGRSKGRGGQGMPCGSGARSNAPDQSAKNRVLSRNEESTRGGARGLGKVSLAGANPAKQAGSGERGPPARERRPPFSPLLPGWVYGSAAGRGIVLAPEPFFQAGRGRWGQKRGQPFCWCGSSDRVLWFKSVPHLIHAPADTELIPAALEQPHNDWGEPAAIV